MATIDDLQDAAEAFLAAAVAALTYTDEGPPPRQYVNAGEPSMDCCGEVVTWTGPLVYADTASGPGALSGAKKPIRGAQPVVTISLRVTRCAEAKMSTSGGKVIFPDPAVSQSDAKRVDQDAWALWNYLRASLQSGTLADTCVGAWTDGGVKLTPQGGCIGWQFTFRYPIEGGVLTPP